MGTSWRGRNRATVAPSSGGRAFSRLTASRRGGCRVTGLIRGPRGGASVGSSVVGWSRRRLGDRPVLCEHPRVRGQAALVGEAYGGGVVEDQTAGRGEAARQDRHPDRVVHAQPAP